MVVIPKTSRKYNFTPLRYPGGKTSLASLFDLVLRENNISGAKYIEPFAGGAGAALNLLLLEKVDSIVINDLDRAVFAFWKSITDSPDEFASRIRDTPVTIEEWRRQRNTIRQENTSLFDLGFAAFFLNRTNHSGILTGGPIGGINQEGTWKIDARFNKDSLIEKIELIAMYRDRITVCNKDGLVIIEEYCESDDAFFYIDPPYYAKGGLLYLNAYTERDHRCLAKLVNSLASTRWILSYDNVEPIKELFKPQRHQFEISLRYQVGTSRMGSELVLISEALIVPPELETLRCSR